MLADDNGEVPQNSLKRVTFQLGDVSVTSPSVTYNYDDVLFARFHTKEDGIIGVDVIKQCDFVWLTEGVILMPSESEKKVY